MLNKGFSLIEMMVTLMIVSIGMLALGSFYASGIRAEGSSLRRLAAVHMAEQVLEEWQNNNVLPTPNCQLVGGGAAGQLALGAPGITCIPNSGVSSPFNIVIQEVNAQAPIPNGHKLYAGPAGGAPMMGSLLTLPTNNASPRVKVRAVKVRWQEDGKLTWKQILLTHITRR